MYKINKLQHGKRFVRDFHEVIFIFKDIRKPPYLVLKLFPIVSCNGDSRITLTRK